MYYVGKAGKGIRILQEAEACSSHIQLVMLIVLAVGPNALYNVQSQS
jgi:hypothetical protein